MSEQQQTQPKTIAHTLHHLWGKRTGSPDYDYEEKRLWMALQRFVESKGGIREPLDNYRV